jgi:hypothetical protein
MILLMSFNVLGNISIDDLLICSERKVLLSGGWWLICSEIKVLLVMADKPDK